MKLCLGIASASIMLILFLPLAKEIYTMFASGTVYYEGQPTIEYDEEEDLCMGSSALCPFRRCGEFLLQIYCTHTEHTEKNKCMQDNTVLGLGLGIALSSD